MTAIPHEDFVGPRDTDADLVHAARTGDRVAFADIYDRYADRLHDFCVGMLRDPDAAADCVQDVFCTAATRLGQLRDPGKLRPWLYSIARNEALKALRERRLEAPSDALPDVGSTDPGPDTLAARTELADLVAAAAGGLSDRDRTVLELSYHQGLTGPELAQALGVSQSNAGTLVVRLRDTVERALGALLVARAVRRTPATCAELAAVLHGWDGRFTVLMRKRVSRHVESCHACDRVRRRLVTPAALLGATPLAIPAPKALRDNTLNKVRLPSVASGPGPEGARARFGGLLPVVIIAAALFAGVAVVIGISSQREPVVTPTDTTAPLPPPQPSQQTPLGPPTAGPGTGTKSTLPPAPISTPTTTTTTTPPVEVVPEPPPVYEPPPVSDPTPPRTTTRRNSEPSAPATTRRPVGTAGTPGNTPGDTTRRRTTPDDDPPPRRVERPAPDGDRGVPSRR